MIPQTIHNLTVKMYKVDGSVRFSSLLIHTDLNCCFNLSWTGWCGSYNGRLTHLSTNIFRKWGKL